jgi:hypothetical protein
MKLRLVLVFGLTGIAMAGFSALFVQGDATNRQQTPRVFSRSIGRYKVKMTQVDEQPASGAYWGAFKEASNTYVDDLSIWVDGQEIYEPMASYSDLSNVNSMTVEASGDGLVINIKGGEATTAYTAQIVVSDNQLIKRIVRDGEFPDQNWEKSQFQATATEESSGGIRATRSREFGR